MLESNKDAHVADRITHVNSSSVGNWCWARPPRGRAQNELRELNNIISSVSLTDHPDSWKCTLDASGCFTSKSLAQLINNLILGVHASNLSIPRNKFTPQKVHILARRVIQKKISVRVELDKRGIDLDTTLCPLCELYIETTDHAIVLCPKTAFIWKFVLKWWNQNNTSISSIDDAFIINQNFTCNNFGSSTWQATKWIVSYTIWKHRNLKVFSKKEWSPASIISEIQAQSFSWISKRCRKKKQIDWHQWMVNPSSYVEGPQQRGFVLLTLLSLDRHCFSSSLRLEFLKFYFPHTDKWSS
ncbi:uncharacterized protein [Rutidosis leptorrhynchoides]|uniref:uncharacterized protein n=1 Tax=Rutidosis leptorrhynchoides TaxID=125765 RepID=UPI003A9A4EA4